MRKILFGLLSTALLSTIVLADAKDEAIKSQNRQVLKMAVDDISKKTPQKIDDYTALTGIRSDDQTLIYIYEINTGAKSDEAVRRDDEERMRNAITRGSCSSSARFLNSGIDLTYIYNNANTKTELFRFHVSKKVCEEG